MQNTSYRFKPKTINHKPRMGTLQGHSKTIFIRKRFYFNEQRWWDIENAPWIVNKLNLGSYYPELGAESKSAFQKNAQISKFL